MAGGPNVKKTFWILDLIFGFCLRIPKEKGIPLSLIGTLLISDYGEEKK